jgi:hypothetical protein
LKEIVEEVPNFPSLNLLPVSVDFEFNSHHPYTNNNGNMLPAKGFQTRLSLGLFSKWRFIDFQLRPDLVYAANPTYEGFTTTHYDSRWSTRYIWWNYSDSPEIHGSDNQWRVIPGQSFFKVKYNGISLGISTENLWWGPGKYNSLTMTNNAEGFWHLGLKTERPLDTRFGVIEGQLIAGRLVSSGYDPPEPLREFRGTTLYIAPSDETRYLSGLVVSYQPRWIKGLFIGGTYVNQQYMSDAGENFDIIPAITDVFKKKDIGIDDRRRPDRYASLFFRWIWYEGNSEIYFEYGRNNFDGTFKNLLLVPEKNAAFVFGLSKLFPLKRDRFIEFNFEMTKLAQQVNYVVRSADSWYIDNFIRQGYTYKGQWLGAGIGPGSNVQTFELNWVDSKNKLGLTFERQLHNSDYYYKAYEQVRDFRRYWVDYSFGLQAYKVFNQFSINGKILYIRSLNYQWELERLPGDRYFIPGRDLSNLHLNINFVYSIN